MRRRCQLLCAFALLLAASAAAQTDVSRYYVPAPLVLYQNAPNPFAPSTTIRFTIPAPRRVTIEVYDVVGRRVATVLDEFVDRAGENRVEWDGTNDRGERVASGVYFCRMTVPGVSRFRKMVVLR